MRKINKNRTILKYTLFLATLLPMIQGTQLYVLFGDFDPILLVMPVVMGTITGFLVGYNRYRVLLQIFELKNIQDNLKTQVKEQTKELQVKNEELNKALLMDPLTALGNRVKLKEVLTFEESRIGKEYLTVSVMMIDIDYFKKYNDYYGHLNGDKVLIELGKFFLFKEKGTENKTIRFGGEEFIVILPNTEREKAQKIAQEYLDGIMALNIEHLKSDITNKVTLSIGIHSSEKISMTEDCECLKRADKALYLAKEEGRNRFKHSEEVI